MPLVGLALALVGAPAGASRADYAGTAACATCHPAETAAWRVGPHARAGERLRAADARDPLCLSCHATGDAPAGAAYLADVGCEACHGAGAAYAPDDVMRDPALARALGLRDLSTASARRVACGRCHRASTSLSPFDAEAGWRRIGHGASAQGDGP